MFRFVDLTEAYGGFDESDPEAPGKPCCGIIDTVTDKFLSDSTGSHVLDGIEEVCEAGGDRAIALVPAGFFDR